MKTLRLCYALAVAFVLVTVSGAGAGERIAPLPLNRILSPAGDPLPSEYQGIWSYTLALKDCETLVTLFSETGTDTICTDDSVVPDTTGAESFSCTGSVTPGGYNYHCTGSTAIDDTCTANIEYDIMGSVSANSQSYVGVFVTTYDRCDEALVASCFRYEYTATRIGTANTECVSPVELTTWGYIKSRYRSDR